MIVYPCGQSPLTPSIMLPLSEHCMLNHDTFISVQMQRPSRRDHVFKAERKARSMSQHIYCIWHSTLLLEFNTTSRLALIFILLAFSPLALFLLPLSLQSALYTSETVCPNLSLIWLYAWVKMSSESGWRERNVWQLDHQNRNWKWQTLGNGQTLKIMQICHSLQSRKCCLMEVFPALVYSLWFCNLL